MNAFILILKNTDKFLLVSGVGNVFMFLGKMSIASLTAFLAFIITENWPEVKSKLDSPMAPTILVFMIAYVVGSIFISIYSVATDTILQCFLVDTDISL